MDEDAALISIVPQFKYIRHDHKIILILMRSSVDREGKRDKVHSSARFKFVVICVIRSLEFSFSSQVKVTLKSVSRVPLC